MLARQDYYDGEILFFDSMALTKLTFCDEWIMMGNRELCLVNQMQQKPVKTRISRCETVKPGSDEKVPRLCREGSHTGRGGCILARLNP